MKRMDDSFRGTTVCCAAGSTSAPSRFSQWRAASCAESLVDPNRHAVSLFLPDRLSHLRLDGELVRPVSHRHEGAPERRAVDRPAHLDEPARAEDLDRPRPDDVGPSALRWALLE